MPLLKKSKRDLLVIEVTQNVSVTSSATHGAAVSPAVGGTFTVGTTGDVYLHVDIPYASTNQNASYAEVHVLVDSTCVLECFIMVTTANIGSFLSRARRLTLSAGDHTVAVHAKGQIIANGTAALVTFKGVSDNGTANPINVRVTEAP